jgi:hypothetical protein
MEDRASLLHNLHPEEIPRLVSFSIEAAERILSEAGESRYKPDNLLHSTRMWYNIVTRAKEILENSWRVLVTDSSEFGKQLFEGKSYLFAFYCLHHYIVEGRCKNKTFIKATEALFFY